MYSYRYMDTETGKPLKRCPECEGDLTAEYGIDIEFTDGSRNWELSSQLEADGHLADANGLVAQGYHSATRCGHCGEMLINMQGVDEQDVSYKR